jgi:signal transduction histidine kinase
LWALPVPPVFPLLLTTLLLSVFFALFSWRGYAEREHYVAQLRPFVASQRLYEQLLETGEEGAPAVDAATPFFALCDDVLGAHAAYLVPLGPLAPLVGAPLVFPPEREIGAPPLGDVTPRLSPRTLCVALNAEATDGMMWAVPLWSERGLIGVLLLGDKRDGGLYTQEEMEIARAGCERLIDTQASAALARRLMALQRQHVAQTQMLDRRARRVLHDDVLPRLHAVLLTFADAPPEALAQLSDAHREISNLLREMPGATTPAVARLGVVEALRQSVADEHPGAFDAVDFIIEPDAERAARQLPPLSAETLFFAAREVLRNAAKHARWGEDDTPLHVRVELRINDALELSIEDNGIGPAATAMPEARGGSGQGLALHGAMLAILGGTLELVPGSESGTRVILKLPLQGQS